MREENRQREAGTQTVRQMTKQTLQCIPDHACYNTITFSSTNLIKSPFLQSIPLFFRLARTEEISDFTALFTMGTEFRFVYRCLMPPNIIINAPLIPIFFSIPTVC